MTFWTGETPSIQLYLFRSISLIPPKTTWRPGKRVIKSCLIYSIFCITELARANGSLSLGKTYLRARFRKVRSLTPTAIKQLIGWYLRISSWSIGRSPSRVAPGYERHMMLGSSNKGKTPFPRESQTTRVNL